MKSDLLNLYCDLQRELHRQTLRLHTLTTHAEVNPRDWERVFRSAQTIVALAEAIYVLVTYD